MGQEIKFHSTKWLTVTDCTQCLPYYDFSIFSYLTSPATGSITCLIIKINEPNFTEIFNMLQFAQLKREKRGILLV